MSFFSISKLTSKNKVKRPSTPTPRPLFLSSPFVHSSLVKGSFKPIVTLPKYVDESEWLAVNVFDFFNYLNLFYGSISDFCTMRDCPTMSAGPGVEYTWIDSQKKSVKLPAPQYIDYVMSWIQNMLNDENVFPTKAGREFPRDFSMTIRMITKQLFRVYAHIFHCHYEPLLHLCAEGHFQSLFGHFMTFAKEFDLLDKKDIQPLVELISEMENNGTIG